MALVIQLYYKDIEYFATLLIQKPLDWTSWAWKLVATGTAFLKQLGEAITSLLCESLDACEARGLWPTLRKIIYLAKCTTNLFDCSTDKHVVDQALADCKGLGTVSLCLCNQTCGGGVFMYPECTIRTDDTCKHQWCGHQPVAHELSNMEACFIMHPMYHSSKNPEGDYFILCMSWQ